MLDYLLGKPSVRVRRIQTLLITFLALILLRKKRPPRVLAILQEHLKKYEFWKIIIIWSALVHLIEHGDDVFGLSAPEPLRQYYSRSFFRAAHILSAMDAGFWTAMFIKPKPLRDFLSIVFSTYYVFTPKKAEEKVRKFRSLITAEHMRVSWEKANTNPVLRLIRWASSPRLTVKQTTYLPNREGDIDLHALICSQNIAKPWNLKWWFDYDPSFGLEPGFKTSEDNVLSALMYTEQESCKTLSQYQSQRHNGDSDFSGKIKIDANPSSGVKPALCYIMYAHDKPLYKKSKRVILNFPGGGFVSMSPPCHDDYLSLWAKNVSAVVVSVDYAKSPEYPFPYAIDQCFEVYKSIVKTNGRCIGIGLDPGEQIEVLIVGDSAGANITAATMFKILESKEQLPLPIGLVFIYGIFNFDIRAWMTDPEIDMLKGVTTTATQISSIESSKLTPRILESKDHLQYQSPLAIDKENSAYESTALSWNSNVKPISEKILLVRDEDEDADADADADGDSPKMSSAEISTALAGSEASAKNYLESSAKTSTKTVEKAQDKNTDSLNKSIHSAEVGPSSDDGSKQDNQNNQNFLSMTSRFTYFSDMVLTPEMMRALAILYIGPNNTPNFEKNYYLSPVVAPEELLARFPNTYFMCGEKDPLVDDTIILAGRIREAKSKLKNLESFGNKESSDRKTTNQSIRSSKKETGSPKKPPVDATSTAKSKVKEKIKEKVKEKPHSSLSFIHAKRNSAEYKKSESDGNTNTQAQASKQNKYKPYVRPGRPDYIKSLRAQLEKSMSSSRFSSNKGTHFYISDSSNPTSAENSESESHESAINSVKAKRQAFKMLRMTKFSDSAQDENSAGDGTRDGRVKSRSNSISRISSISNFLRGRSYSSDENELEQDEGVWDLTAIKSDSFLPQRSNSLQGTSDDPNFLTVRRGDRGADYEEEDVTPSVKIHESELCSTVIKVKILKGMSHGFMQMGSIFPEALASIKTIGEWMNELFNLEEQLVTSYSRCGSVASLNELLSSSASLAASVTYSEDHGSDAEKSATLIPSLYLANPKLGIDHFTSVVSNISDRVKVTLFSTKSNPGSVSSSIKVGDGTLEPQSAENSAHVNSKVEARVKSSSLSPPPGSKDTSNEQEKLEDVENYAQKLFGSKPNENIDTSSETSTSLSLEHLRKTKISPEAKCDLEAKVSILVEKASANSSPSSSILKVSDRDSDTLHDSESSVQTTPKTDGKASLRAEKDVRSSKKVSKPAKKVVKSKSNGSAVDRHGNEVVTSVEMLRNRENHLIENLRK